MFANLGALDVLVYADLVTFKLSQASCLQALC